MKSLIAYIRQSLQGQYSLSEIKSLVLFICNDELGISSIELYTCKYTDLSTEKRQKLQDIINRLLQHEPIQYICGSTSFCGLSFRVTSAVLIPRIETEELVKLVSTENKEALHILDIGTGSGCIAISLDKQIPNAVVDGWDVSSDALAIAEENNLRLKAKVHFSLCDVFSSKAEDNNSFYDVIVSNPPYVTENDKKEMQPEVLDYEPQIALFVPDDDSLCYYRRIAQLAKKLLKPKGGLYFEINQRLGNDTRILLEEMGYDDIRLLKDQFDNDRMMTARLP